MIYRPGVRRATLAAWDVLCWGIATIVVVGARYDFTISEVQWTTALTYLAVSVALLVAIGYASKMYRGRFRVASFEEALGLAVLAASVAVITIVYFVMIDDGLPRGIAFLVPVVALVGSAGGRWAYRILRTRPRGPSQTAQKTVLVYGAGDAGYQLLRLVLMSRDSQYRIVGFIDDNPGKRNLKLIGVPVVGTREVLDDAARTLDADCVILAIPSASGEFIGGVQDAVQRSGMEFLSLPPVTEIIGGRVSLEDVRKVEITDVLGRHQVTTDLGSIADYIAGRKVLITGAGGSIGAELARQVHKFGPSDLIMLDRDESALHSVQLSIYGRGLLDTPDLVLCDIRDEEALRKIFETHHPEIVFHAAALKHLPMLEQYPEEGWKTNVLGTLNMLQLSKEFGVGRFVNISTDKAADPTSVLGKTKRLAEHLTAWAAQDAAGSYMSVRFGNVLGSRGSMLHAFNAQIEKGGPVTVTHPDITRYFMTIPEACELVIQAGAIGGPGEVLVLDMGTPIKILDVAKRMILHSQKNVEIVFTGLRPGEKMHEELFGSDERGTKTTHPLITQVAVPPMDPETVRREHPSEAHL